MGEDPNDRFRPENSTAEDLLKAQTTGLVSLSDFRKRRAEAIEQRESGQSAPGSGLSTPGDSATPPPLPKKQKKKKQATSKVKLSFADEEDEDQGTVSKKPSTQKPADKDSDDPPAEEDSNKEAPRVRLGPNSRIGAAPKAMTKAALQREAQLKERLKTDFYKMQQVVKATELKLPFTFYDGTDTLGGTVKVKKGDLIWLFLDRARKVGAGLNTSDKSTKEWARISVDDLMLVRGDIIIPHHYDFYYFIIQKTKGFKGQVLFNYSEEPTAGSPQIEEEKQIDANYDPLSKPGQKESAPRPLIDESLLEGSDVPASMTRVVDRRWYQTHKHLYPASTWATFEPDQDYSTGVRTDTAGNRFFFSS